MSIDQIKISRPSGAPWLKRYNSHITTANEAVKVIKSGDKIVMQPGCAVPMIIVNAMVERKEELREVEIIWIEDSDEGEVVVKDASDDWPILPEAS